MPFVTGVFSPALSDNVGDTPVVTALSVDIIRQLHSEFARSECRSPVMRPVPPHFGPESSARLQQQAGLADPVLSVQARAGQGG
jgi:hypothetical protein